MNIVIVCKSYPTKVEPVKHVFLQKLVWAFADQGHDCSVIRPVNKLEKRLNSLPEKSEAVTLKGNKVKLYFPRYTGFWFTKRSKNDFIQEITLNNFTNSIYKLIISENLGPDIIYGHFLTPAGIAVSRISRKLGIKGFAAFGESSPWSLINKGSNKAINEINMLTGIVSVSTENKRRLLELGILSENSIEVFPNGVDLSIYQPLDRELSRDKFNFNNDDFIVAFVGSFNERKGVLRVANALKNENDIKIAFAGKGDDTPTNSNSIYQGVVLPKEMPAFLSAADLFVLPTLNEGCCNAIIEAMACGLPIVSSNLAFNDDILNGENSIRVDPRNLEEIRSAVLKVKKNKSLRKKMSRSALKSASNLNIEKRAENIIRWFNSF